MPFTYTGRLEGGVAVDDRLDGELGLLTVERDGDVGDLERMLGNMSSRVCRLDRFVELSNVRVLQLGRRVTHLDEEQHSLVLILARSALADNDAVSNELELFHNRVDFGRPESHAALQSCSKQNKEIMVR